ncbi:MAG: metal ABC transporter permease [Actinomycetales bacterium]|nr:metal ABC transporter permease [Actinomycetales bacterium]
MLSYDFMQRAMLAAVVVGVIAPLIGTFLVQRRLALLGDGMGHVALTGVGLAFLVGSAPVGTALIVTVVGAIALEVIRARSRTAGDLALALLFYGGIAGGVLFASLATGSGSAALNQYLFGSLVTVSTGDVWALLGAAVVIIAVLGLLGRVLFLVALDPALARTQGVRVELMSAVLTVLTAVAVVVGMRTVGLLLVSAVMIIPIATAQQFAGSFRITQLVGSAIGLVCCVGGLTLSYVLDAPPGAVIVLLALVGFVVAAIGRAALARG